MLAKFHTVAVNNFAGEKTFAVFAGEVRPQILNAQNMYSSSFTMCVHAGATQCFLPLEIINGRHCEMYVGDCGSWNR